MTQSTKQTRNAESGFTLVELAIVMIIIGLLIGGILKGQELINNARLSSTVSQTKAVESGVSGFRDKFGTMPGDVANAATRVPNCTAAICSAAAVGNGDTLVQTGTANQAGGASTNANEAFFAFAQLGAAGFLGGITPNATAAGIGASNPSTPLGGTWNFGYANGSTAGTGQTGTVALLPGHYIVSATAVGAAASAATPGAGSLTLTPSQAASIDRKVDDGVPNTGSVMGIGAVGTGAATCADANAVTSGYREANTANNCGLYVKVQ